MKTLRLLLLVLLALLLPFRGALAEVAHCGSGSTGALAGAWAPAGGPSQGNPAFAGHDHHHDDAGHHATPAVHAADPHGHDHDHRHHHDDAHAHGDHASHGGMGFVDDVSGATSLPSAIDACEACSASCASPPLLSAAPAVLPSLPIAGADYPALVAPPPRHASDGPERPPRSC